MPVFLDFPIELLRRLLEFLLSVDRCDAVNGDAIGERGFPFAMTMTEVDPLAFSQWARISFDISMRITCVQGKLGIDSKRGSHRPPFPIADMRSFCKSA